MAFNGSGTYVLPGAALVDGQTVSATEHNTLRNDMATAFTTCVTRDGQSPATANLPMGGFKLTGLAAGTGNGESVRFEQLVATSIVNTPAGSIAATTVQAAINELDTEKAALAGATFTGAITPSQTLGIVGTTTNNDASAGSVGEYVSSTIASGSAVSLTTGNAANVTSISLTAGDWDVSAFHGIAPAATTSFTFISGSISTTSATHSAASQVRLPSPSGVVYGGNTALSGTTIRISIAATTTIYLVASALFSVSTCGAYGTLSARRVR